MNENQQVIIRFYQAFQQLDWKTMQQCYHADARFSDPVFQDLNSAEVKAMWHMLCSNAKNFSLEFTDVIASDQKGACRWDARYTFSATGREVHNFIRAAFTFREGLIVKHTDTFSFWRWSRMSLGWTGWLLGWSPFLKRKIQVTARKGLNRFMKANYT